MNRWMIAAGVLVGGALACAGVVRVASAGATGEAEIAAAICPVVYPLDQSSAERGVHYTFYGNAFFIDEDGYLITAAHVLTDFRDGGQAHILLNRPEAPPRMLKVEVVATDGQHDIAILRAVPNPFEGKYAVAFLPLGTEKPAPGTAVVAEALRPSRLKDPHTFDAPREERSPAGVLQYTTTKLDNGQAELFLFDHEVERGQSGAPVIARETQEVLGIVEGQWLRGISVSPTPFAGNHHSNIGAAVPIIYALPLLEAKQIPFHTQTVK
jgi:S1-C subfamily serine protease